jgi:hypothetical protein
MSMHVFWMILLLVLAIPPLLIPLCSRGSQRDFWRKSAIQTVTDVVPRKFRFMASVLYLALVAFTAAKVKGLL